MRKLWPPLADIARLLSHPEAPLSEDCARGDDLTSDTVLDTPPPMPELIAGLIRRQVAAHGAFPVQQPAAGLLVCLQELPGKATSWPFAGTLAMLLDRQDITGYWHGWLATGETDYATDADVLLEPEDEPFDPSVGVIQLWNTVRLRIDGNVKPLGRVNAKRLAAFRTLAGQLGESSFMTAEAHPGRMQLRDSAGLTLLCGTPLGNPNDPRWAYRALYASAANRLQEAWNAGTLPATPQSARATGSAKARSGWLAALFKPGFALAAVVALAVGNLALLLDRERVQDDYAQFRSEGAPTKRVPEVEVRLRDNARSEEIRVLLLEIQGELAGGPGQLGIYRIALPDGNVSEAVEKLRASRIVESVTVPGSR